MRHCGASYGGTRSTHVGGGICVIIFGAGCLVCRVFARGHVVSVSCRLSAGDANAKGQVRAYITAFSVPLPLTGRPAIILLVDLVSDRRIQRASRNSKGGSYGHDES
jgi:hypothetical protein